MFSKISSGIRMRQDKKLFAGLLLLIFLGVTFVAIRFIQERRNLSKDSFRNPRQKFALAAECNCLPGYIPSKSPGCSMSSSGTEYFCKRLCDSGDTNCDPVKDVKACF